MGRSVRHQFESPGSGFARRAEKSAKTSTLLEFRIEQVCEKTALAP